MMCQDNSRTRQHNITDHLWQGSHAEHLCWSITLTHGGMYEWTHHYMQVYRQILNTHSLCSFNFHMQRNHSWSTVCNDVSWFNITPPFLSFISLMRRDIHSVWILNVEENLLGEPAEKKHVPKWSVHYSVQLSTVGIPVSHKLTANVAGRWVFTQDGYTYCCIHSRIPASFLLFKQTFSESQLHRVMFSISCNCWWLWASLLTKL